MKFLLKFSCFCKIKTMSNKKGKIFLVTHNEECKKNIIEEYMHFLVGMKHAYLY